MSNTTEKISWNDAIEIVQALRSDMRLDSLCIPRISDSGDLEEPGWIVAGSVRRRKPEVGDIEIVAVPRPSGHDLMGQASSNEIIDALDRMLTSRRIRHPDDRRCWGTKMRRFIYRETRIEFYLASQDGWPVVLAIRTGPAEMSRRLVTERSYGGMLPDGYRVSVADGRVYRKSVAPGGPETALEFRSEREFFEFCGGWIEPRERT